MKWLRRFWRRLHETVGGSRRDDEFLDEIDAHVALLTDEYVRSGLPRAEARRRAILRFGNREAVRESWRDQRRLPLVDSLVQDLRWAIRGLAKDAGFAMVSVLTLTLGIGANSAIFSVVNGVLIQPLPYPAAHQLVQVWETNPRANRWGDWASYPDFDDWRRDATTFEAMAAFRYGQVKLTSGDVPEMLVSLRVSPELFSVLRVPPMIGRGFLADEERTSQSDVAVLSHGLWQRQFGSDPAVVGRAIQLDGRAHRIVGVMPPGFDFPSNLQPEAKAPELWIPLTPDPARGSHNFRVIARLGTGRTIEQAQADMDRVMRNVATVAPAHRGRGSAVAGLQQRAVTGVQPTLLVLMGAIAVVLLIACVNVANLQLARGLTKRRDVALRLALGASPARVVQQGLIESLVLAVAGAGTGLLVAAGGMRFLKVLAPAVPLMNTVGIDAQVLGFTVMAAFVTAVGFGLAPTLQAMRVRANDAFKDAGDRHVGGARHARVRTVLTVAEVALALILMIGAGLFIRSFATLRGVDLGFSEDKLMIATLRAPSEASSDVERTVAFFDDVLARAAQVPGVASVAAASAVPFVSNESSPFRIEGRPSAEAEVFAEQPKVTPDYFPAMGIRLFAGRSFDRGDAAESEAVAIVSKGLADAYWPGQDALGRRLQIDDRQWRRVVGVVQDVKHDGLDRPARPTIYIPFAQYPRATMTLLIRSDVDPGSIVTGLRQAVMSVNRDQPLYGIQTMEETLAVSLSTRRLLMILSILFACVAVSLGTVGVYGVLAYFVEQRRQELAIRAALGAKRAEVIWLVVKQGTLLAIGGVILGLFGSFALSRTVAGLLFGVSPIDPWTFAAMPTLLVGVVVTASFLSARGVGRGLAGVLRNS